MKFHKLKPIYNNERIWVIGASEGIGKQLCNDLHKLGANLVLSARSEDKLAVLSKELSNCPYYKLDVVKYDECKSVCNKVFKHGYINRIIYLPAYYEPMKLDTINLHEVKKTIDTNLMAVFNFIDIILPYLKANLSMQLSVFGSVAGYFGLPNSQPYSSTKAGVISIIQSLRLEHPDISLKLINSGFIKTRLTDKNRFNMPKIISTQKASFYILKGLKSNNFEIHFPKSFTIIMKIINLLPYSIFLKLINKISK
jgi:short-subunit dehydrogenase